MSLFSVTADEAAPRTASRTERLLLVAIVLLGVGLRVRHYAQDAPFRIDEARLGVSIVEGSYGSLLRPLPYQQAAPLGFLFLSHTARLVLGAGELALRAVPFACGVASLLVFALLARRLLPAAGTLAAVLLFAVGDQLVSWSADIKQYAIDPLATSLVLLAAVPLVCGERSSRALWRLGLTGALCIPFSHPVPFVLGGVGIAALPALAGAPRRVVRQALAIGLCWVAVFALLYLFSYRDVAGYEGMEDYWESGFAPLPTGREELEWYLTALRRPLWTAGFKRLWLPPILVALGLLHLLRNRRRLLLLLVAPFALTLLGSLLREYPFGSQGGRMLHFLAPLTVLLMACGFAGPWRWIRAPWRLALLVPLAALAFHAGRASFYLPDWSGGRRDMPAVLEHVRERFEPGDALHAERGLFLLYLYYGPRFGLPAQSTSGDLVRNDGSIVAETLDELGGHRRAWVIVEELSVSGDFERAFRDTVRSALGARGRLVDERDARGLSCYLYEFP